MNSQRTTNILLLLIAIPIVFLVLKTLSFILVPLAFSIFLSFLFMPMMRALTKRNFPKAVSITLVALIVVGSIVLVVSLFQLSAQEVVSGGDDFLQNAQTKIDGVYQMIADAIGMETGNEGVMESLNNQSGTLVSGIGTTLGAVGRFITQGLMTLFFMLLWLSESINIMDLFKNSRHKKKSVAAFIRIKDDLITFIKVKFWVSFGTGVFTGVACYFFDVSFPILWGIFAFAINFVQMVGSVITVVLLSIFAMVEMEMGLALFFFVISITMVQVIFGGILEPIFMGKSFSINVITVLVMLSLWGFIWGVPGLILSIPITVFIKIMLEQSPKTEFIARLLSGNSQQIKLPIRRKTA